MWQVQAMEEILALSRDRFRSTGAPSERHIFGDGSFLPNPAR